MDELARSDADADQWTNLILKAIAEDGDVLGRKPGRALWPLLWDEKALRNRKASMMTTEGSRAWEALYQQNPTPQEGALFKVSHIQYCDPGEIPEGLQVVRRWDMAASAGKNDFTVGLKLAGPDKFGRFYVLDVVRGQWSVGERNKIIVQTAQRDGPGVRILGPIDPGSSGVEAAQHFRTMLSGYNVRTERETGSKEVRAGAPAAIVEDGRLFLVRGHWNPEFVEELRQFPNGVHDDQVDTLSGAVAELALKAARMIDWG
jgi:predicted phage terminase large subunit-like protein